MFVVGLVKVVCQKIWEKTNCIALKNIEDEAILNESNMATQNEVKPVSISNRIDSPNINKAKVRTNSSRKFNSETSDCTTCAKVKINCKEKPVASDQGSLSRILRDQSPYCKFFRRNETVNIPAMLSSPLRQSVAALDDIPGVDSQNPTNDVESTRSNPQTTRRQTNTSAGNKI